jgi:O-antigen ligase
MGKKLTGAILKTAFAASALGFCLFADILGPHFPNIAGAMVGIISIPSIQTAAFLSIAIYFAFLTVLQDRGSSRGFPLVRIRNLILTGFLLLGALFHYSHREILSQLTPSFGLLLGATLGKGMALCVDRGSRSCTVDFILLPVLVVGALWPDRDGAFHYRTATRITGPWDSPNIFGMLMATGVVLCVGRLMSLYSRDTVPGGLRTSQTTLLLGSLGLMCNGLTRSYSRGAWAGMVLGIAYLLFSQRAKRERIVGSSATQCLSLVPPALVVLLSIIVLSFWIFRFNESMTVVARAFSAANANDFSWRNRLAAYEGSLQMMTEKPLLGFGWDSLEPTYDQFYKPLQLQEGAAIQVSDWLAIGTALGIPGLVSFAVFIWLSLARNFPSSASTPRSQIALNCRAAAVVLVVGFFFNKGLFRIPTAAVFWTLLEVGNTRPASETE